MNAGVPASPAAALGTGFATGVVVMTFLAWHVDAHWADIYARFPLSTTGLSAETLARQPADYVMSSLSLRLAQYLAGTAAFVLALAMPGRVRLLAIALLAGACLPPAVALVSTPGAFSSNLGPFAVLLNLVFSAAILGIGVLAGALPAATINLLRRRLAAN